MVENGWWYLDIFGWKILKVSNHLKPCNFRGYSFLGPYTNDKDVALFDPKTKNTWDLSVSPDSLWWGPISPYSHIPN